MRRGLIAWSKAELPESVFDSRLQRLRGAMTAEGLDAFVVYTNNTRPAAVSWLTAFVPYWAEGLLVVPRDGDAQLSMAFSNRIVGWGKGVSRVARFEGVPRIGIGAGKYIVERGAKRIGVADLDGLRLDVANDLAETAPDARLVDATALFERVRARADPAEIALAAKAGAIAQRALSRIDPGETQLRAIIAAVESTARLAGAEEVYMAASADLLRDDRFLRVEAAPPIGRSYALRATVAYKGCWVRMTRTIIRDAHGASLTDRAAELFAAAVATLPSSDGFKGFKTWLVEGCRLAQPLDPLLGSRIEAPRTLAPGTIVTAQAVIELDRHRIAIAAPVLVGTDGSPSSVLVPPAFGRR